MAHYKLTTPLTEADVRQLRLEDTVTIDGTIFGIRDATQIRIFDHGVAPPADLTGGVCLHTAPGVKKMPDGRYEKICIGTTTSTRMDRFVPGLVEQYGVRAVVGKGGVLEGSIQAMQRVGAVYLAIVGGAAALETLQIEEIEEVWWEDLMPECLWKFRVKDFGPLFVAVDSHGNSHYRAVQERAAARIAALELRPPHQSRDSYGAVVATSGTAGPPRRGDARATAREATAPSQSRLCLRRSVQPAPDPLCAFNDLRVLLVQVAPRLTSPTSRRRPAAPLP